MVDETSHSTEKLQNVEVPDIPDEITYHPVPGGVDVADPTSSVWRIRLERATDPAQRLGLDIYDDVMLGRDGDEPNLVDLNFFDAKNLGVSRQHLLLQPGKNQLFVTDLGSTNGTRRNGRSIGVHTPYALVNGDILSLGELNLVVQIVDRPRLYTAGLERRLDLADALTQIAKSITSQLDLDEVLNQVVRAAMTLTAAGATSIWLVDESSGELFLEVEQGIEDDIIRRKRLPADADSPAGKVLQTGKPLRAWRQPGEEQIKVVTNYLVEALAYVPITLGGTTFGVLAATHREAGKRFDRRDERLLVAIADFAAIAIQNARSYEATDRALARRYKELSALSELARSVSSSLDLGRVHAVLTEQINKHWPVAVVRLYLLDERRHQLQRLRWDGQRETLEATLSPDKGIMGHILHTGQSVLTNDPDQHAAYDPAVEGIDGTPPQTLAAVPLQVQERIVGVLALFNKEDGHFTRDDMGRLEAFANPVATAVENARLFRESERQRAAIQATSQILSQPLIIVDEYGTVLVANEAAHRLQQVSMSQLFNAISTAIGRTTEVSVGDEIFLCTAEHVPDIGTIAVMQDITYVKQLEADRANFIHMLSHDLKQPMTSITGWAALLTRTQQLDDKGEAYVEYIGAATDRMLDMINHLLSTVSEYEAVQLTMQPCSMPQIVATVLADANGSALSRSITLDHSSSGDAYPILADRMRLYHMLLNLVDNAVKYSPPDTTVNLHVVYGEDALTIQVQDQGPGIPPDKLEQVFQKHFRLDTGQGQPGSGLGLSVVRTIALEHGGAVVAANRKAGGANFTVTLPASLRLPAGDEPAEPDAPDA